MGNMNIVLIAFLIAGLCARGNTADIFCYVCEDCGDPFDMDPDLLMNCNEFDGPTISTSTTLTNTPPTVVTTIGVTSPTAPPTTTDTTTVSIATTDESTTESTTLDPTTQAITEPTEPIFETTEVTENTNTDTAATEVTNISTTESPATENPVTDSIATENPTTQGSSTEEAQPTTAGDVISTASPPLEPVSPLPEIVTTIDIGTPVDQTSTTITASSAIQPLNEELNQTTIRRFGPSLLYFARGLRHTRQTNDYRCFTIKEIIDEDTIKVSRGCVRENDSLMDTCIRANPDQSSENCKICDYDKCNNSAQLMRSLFVIVIALFGWMIL